MQAAIDVLARQHALCADEIDVEHPGRSTLFCQDACCAMKQKHLCMTHPASLARLYEQMPRVSAAFASPARSLAMRATMHIKILLR